MSYPLNKTNWGMLALALLLAFGSIGARLHSTTLRGTVYNDVNSNGVHDEGESGVIDIRVQVSTPDLSFVHEYRTADDGTYGPVLGQGTFNVRLILPDHWALTTRASYEDVFVEQGKAVIGLDFGIVQSGEGAPASASSVASAPVALPTTGGQQPDPVADLLPILSIWFAVFGLAFVALVAYMPRRRNEE